MIRSIALFAAAIPLLAQNPMTDAVKSAYNRMKQNLIETAEVMPEADYGYRLTPPQRPFGEWIEHTAAGNYAFCAAMRGTPPPDAAKALPGLKSKGEIRRGLAESFEYCDGALNGMTDQKALSEVVTGERKSYPVQAMISLIGSLNEHYGNLVGYFRSRGIVPPSSARGARTKK
jgi:hypothetical protein